MSKDTKDPHAPAADAGAGTSVNTGVAIIGFLLCFLAGVALMWGYDQHRLEGRRHRGRHRRRPARAWDDSESPVPDLEQGPDVGQARRAGHHRPVYSDFQCPFCSRVEPTMDQVQDDVRAGQGPHRLEEQPAALPPEREARGRGRPGRLRARRATTRSGSSTTPRSRTRARSATDSYAKWAQDAGVKDAAEFKAGLDEPQVGRQGRQGPERRQGRRRAGHAGVLHQRRLHQRRAAVRQVQEAHRPGAREGAGEDRRRARRRTRVYVEMSKENKKNAPRREERGRGREGRHHDGVQGPGRQRARCSAARTRSSPSSSSRDFQCPFCKRVEPTLKGLRDKYGDKVRLVWKNEPLPFHPRAEPAAEAAMEARAEKGDKGFWDAHDKLFDDQQDLANGRTPNLDASSRSRPTPASSADKVKKADRRRTSTRRRSTPTRTSARTSRRAARRTSSSTAAASSARSRRRSSRRSSTRRSRRRRTSIAKGTQAERRLRRADQGRQGPARAGEEGRPQVAPANDPARGNMNAKVVIHEWSDFQCPFCGRVEPTVAQVMKDYGDKIKFVWHDLPLPMHPDAPLAAQAAREAFKQKGPTASGRCTTRCSPTSRRSSATTSTATRRSSASTWTSGRPRSTAARTRPRSTPTRRPATTTASAARPRSSSSRRRENGYFISGAQAVREVPQAHRAALSEAVSSERDAVETPRDPTGPRGCERGLAGHFRPDLFDISGIASSETLRSIDMNHRFLFAFASRACSPRARRRLAARRAAGREPRAASPAAPRCARRAGAPEDDAACPIDADATPRGAAARRR